MDRYARHIEDDVIGTVASAVGRSAQALARQPEVQISQRTGLRQDYEGFSMEFLEFEILQANVMGETWERKVLYMRILRI